MPDRQEGGERMGYRCQPPFNGMRFCWNKATNEMHDLINEKPECKINEINPDHIEMFKAAWQAYDVQKQQTGKENGCFWCQRDRHTD